MYSKNSVKAYENVRKNKRRIWSVPFPGPGQKAEHVDPEHGGSRIYGDLTKCLDYQPRFSIKPNAKIFTIGSCFAREVEKALLDKGYSVLTRMGYFPYSHGYLNRYNTYAMLQELEFALGAKQFNQDSVVKFRKGHCDLTSYGVFESKEEAILLRSITTDLFKSILESDIIVITSGLSEVWYDHKFNTYTNISPNEASINEPERFSFKVINYNENISALEQLILLVHKIVPNAHILLTVSPVPLNATFVERDVLISNSYSKSCLRAAVEELYWKYDFTDYFPSYEMVTLSDYNIVWESDRRHVKSEFVSQIMDNFLSNYISPGA